MWVKVQHASRIDLHGAKLLSRIGIAINFESLGPVAKPMLKHTPARGCKILLLIARLRSACSLGCICPLMPTASALCGGGSWHATNGKYPPSKMKKNTHRNHRNRLKYFWRGKEKVSISRMRNLQSMFFLVGSAFRNLFQC
jgi:hypothetical protein